MTPATIKSAQRTLSIFELFADLRRPARVTELHSLLGLPQSSTSKLLRTFTKLGYLEYDRENRTFYPTLRVTMLGSWLHDQWFGHDSLLATMESLRSTLGTSVLIGSQNDKYVMYMMALQALVAPRPPLAIGTLRPICVAAAGKALMMGKTDQEIGLMVRRVNAEEPDPAKHISQSEFLAEIAVCRERGYAMSEGQVVTGTGVVAMPLAPIPGQPPMVMGVGATLDWLHPNLPLVVETLRNKLTDLAIVSGKAADRD